jgi:hypothetical protein
MAEIDLLFPASQWKPEQNRVGAFPPLLWFFATRKNPQQLHFARNNNQPGPISGGWVVLR